MKGIYQLWAIKNKGYTFIGSYNTMATLKKAWVKNHGSAPLEARVYMGDTYSVVNDNMPKLGEPRLSSPDAWQKSIVDKAVLFTVVRFLGVGRYERHERKRQKDAEKLAVELSRQNKKAYLIYAVNKAGNYVLVGVAKPNKGLENVRT